MPRAPLVVLLGLCAAAGCSREEELRCQDDEPYGSSTSVPPIRVPDDLTVPDESDSLLIPDVPSTAEGPPPQSCLESPPDYFDDEETEG